jgi:hypothetical protein
MSPEIFWDMSRRVTQERIPRKLQKVKIIMTLAFITKGDIVVVPTIIYKTKNLVSTVEGHGQTMAGKIAATSVSMSDHSVGLYTCQKLPNSVTITIHHIIIG